MYNRTLNRPMFRRGGRAGGGIMTGVQRQGYAGEGDGSNQSVVKNDPTKLQSRCFIFKTSHRRYDQKYKPYPYKAI